VILSKLLRGLFPRTTEALELTGFRRAWSAAGRRGISFTCAVFAPEVANVVSRLDKLEKKSALPAVELEDLRAAVAGLEGTLAEGIAFINHDPSSFDKLPGFQEFANGD